MKKITAIILTALLLISSSICVSAKAYEFVGNQVLFSLTKEASERVYNGELVINKEYFKDSGIGIKIIEKGYSIKTFAHYKMVLDKVDFENVLAVSKILEKYEDIESAEPNYYCGIPEYGINKHNVVLKAGETEKIKLTCIDGTAKWWKSTDEKVATVKNGKITALRKGTAKIIVKDTNGRKYTCKLWVTSNPKLTKNDEVVKNIKVEKGGSTKVKITGKAKKIDNIYANTNCAKITSSNSDDTLKICGVEKGTTTLKVRVNGVKTLKLKVKVI